MGNELKNGHQITTVVFDMDGTVLNTLEDLAGSMNYSLKAVGMPERTVDEFRRFVGNGAREALRKALPEGTSTDILDEMFTILEGLKNLAL